MGGKPGPKGTLKGQGAKRGHTKKGHTIAGERGKV